VLADDGLGDILDASAGAEVDVGSERDTGAIDASFVEDCCVSRSARLTAPRMIRQPGQGTLRPPVASQ
jgi:hypothetical protein